MRHIHPFPARMAPEIAIEKVQALSPGQTVLDPMAGSGMVLSQAARYGINAVGVDLDPLAELISRVGATPINIVDVEAGLRAMLSACAKDCSREEYLPWIDDDIETRSFIDFWFAEKQKTQLRKFAWQLCENRLGLSPSVLDVLKVAVSRLIITKEPKASLARDTAHSRPHRTISENDFDVFSALPASVKHISSVLGSANFSGKVSTKVGDARKLDHIGDDTVDLIITSPPYLNAIDYMRGHRLSLVWLGFGLGGLREVRGTAIGAEKSRGGAMSERFAALLLQMGLSDLPTKTAGMLQRYFDDLVQQTGEAFRVLKAGSVATYVIGNCTIRGIYIQNSEFLKHAAFQAGFALAGEAEREIPDNRRYMPVAVNAGNSLGSRMRKEHIIDLRKVA